MVLFVDVMGRFHKKMYLNHFKMELCTGLGSPQKEHSLMVGDTVVDLDVVSAVFGGLEGWDCGEWGVGSSKYNFVEENVDYK